MKAPNIKKLIQQVQASITKSDKMIKESKPLIEKMNKETAVAEKEHTQKQQSIDQDIIKITQDMDKATVQYVKDTE
ncbi:MAG: hypothetical protein US74_C0006G0053 [Parcubacteria group bacterium GW2011_GWA2_38_13]|nr:MAG: hypothetical protein US74_C0006G0053 [Parcubacteria group bacterium GW2011_GWA2_38_13]